MSDQDERRSPPLEVTSEHIRHAEDRLRNLPWIPMLTTLLDGKSEIRSLSSNGYRALHRALVVQWEEGRIPSDARKLSRLINVSLPAAKEALALFLVDSSNDELCYREDFDTERRNSIDKRASSIARASRGGQVKSAAGRPSPTPPTSPPPASGTAIGTASGTSQSLPKAVVQDNTRHDSTTVVKGGQNPGPRSEVSPLVAEDVRRAAEVAVRAGLVVVACDIGGKGFYQRKVLIRSSQELTTKWPKGVAVNLGHVPGLATPKLWEVDIDNAEGKALAERLSCFSEPTYCVATARSKATGHPKHFPDACRLRFLAPPGIDLGQGKVEGILEVFGAAGHVLLPPSWIDEYGTGYTVELETPPLPAPTALVAAVRQAMIERSRPVSRPVSPNSLPAWEVLNKHAGFDLRRRLSGPGISVNLSCPAHVDREPSLSVSVNADGRPLFHCHAGCTAAAVLEALDLDWTAVYGKVA